MSLEKSVIKMPASIYAGHVKYQLFKMELVEDNVFRPCQEEGETSEKFQRLLVRFFNGLNVEGN